MNKPVTLRLTRVFDFLGAHRVEDRVRHEIDRVIQRVVISLAVGVVTQVQEPQGNRLDVLVHATPWLAALYVGLSLLYARLIRARADAGVAAQYAFLVSDPLLTVLALMAAPELLAPLNIFLMVQIVRCGIRYGVRTLWLTWSVSVVCSALLLPLSDFWVMSQPLTLSHIAMLAITPLLFAPLIQQLHKTTDGLRRAATSDPLTGLGNRRRLSEQLAAAQSRGTRDGTMLALILFDLDRFKAVNDVHGHARGDELLLGVTRALQASLRPGDYLARIGGDEFVLLVEGLSPTEGPAQAQVIADKVARIVRIAAHEICPDPAVTASVGVHCWRADQPVGPAESDLLHRADQAMYRVKRSQRAGAQDPPAPDRT